jgi:glycosyltransferase involved in cell wall biosynthesis
VVNHVVVVTDSLSVDGGSGRVALSSAIAIADRGIGVTLFAATGALDEGVVLPKNMRVVCTNQDYVFADPSLSTAWQGVWNVKARRAMLDALADLDPRRSVVHVHSWTKAISSSAIDAAIRSGFRVVVTLHEYFTACPNGALFIHPEAKICTLRPMSGACITTNCDSRSYAHKLYRVARQLVQERVAGIPSQVKHFITVSEFSENILRPLLPPSAKYHPVQNPVDAVEAPRAETERHDTFVFVGRLSAEKGGPLFARAATKANVKARFIGDGFERENIENLCPQSEITGWLGTEGVRAELRQARALVMPSLWYETFGLVVLEASAVGVPAIVADTSTARDLVVDGETGLHFRGGDEDDLASKLELLKNDVLVEKMSRAAYQRFWDMPPTIDAHVDKLLEVYSEVLAEPGIQPSDARKPLRIALVSRRVLRTEGQGRVNNEIVRHAVGRGHTFTVVSEQISEELLGLSSVTWQKIAVPRLPTQLLRNIVFCALTTAWVLRNRRHFDLVQMDGFASFARSDVNVAHYVHSDWLRSKALWSDSFRSARGFYQLIYATANSFFEKGAFRRTRYGVAVCEGVKDGMVRLGMPAERVAVISNGVEMHEGPRSAINRSSLGIPEGRFLALFAGDLQTSRKNLDSLLRAVALVPDIHLAVAGELRSQRFPSLARSLGIADRVHFVGFRKEDLFEIMAAADVFVMASHYEPFGLVILEAMAAGTAVITARCVGASSLVGPAGVVLAHADDVAGLAIALARLAANPRLAAEMGRRGREIARGHSVDRMAEGYTNFYESVSAR